MEVGDGVHVMSVGPAAVEPAVGVHDGTLLRGAVSEAEGVAKFMSQNRLHRPLRQPRSDGDLDPVEVARGGKDGSGVGAERWIGRIPGANDDPPSGRRKGLIAGVRPSATGEVGWSQDDRMPVLVVPSVDSGGNGPREPASLVDGVVNADKPEAAIGVDAPAVPVRPAPVMVSVSWSEEE